MPTLEKSENIKLNSEKKSYRQPQVKEIGRVNDMTKGGGPQVKFDGLSWNQTNS